jgi:putative transposase
MKRNAQLELKRVSAMASRSQSICSLPPMLSPPQQVIWRTGDFISRTQSAISRNGKVISGTGSKDVLGLWIEQNEGARFWLKVMNELKTRGVEDVLIAVVDGLKGFPEAITAVSPPNHGPDLHRASDALWAYCSWQDRRKVAGQLKNIYRAVSAIESLHMRLRKVIKNRGHFPTDEAAAKLIYLALRNIVKDWKVPAWHWQAAMNQFAIVFGERFFAAGLVPQQKDKN